MSKVYKSRLLRDIKKAKDLISKEAVALWEMDDHLANAPKVNNPLINELIQIGRQYAKKQIERHNGYTESLGEMLSLVERYDDQDTLTDTAELLKEAMDKYHNNNKGEQQ